MNTPSGKTRRNSTPVSGGREDQLERIDVFKKMCRMLEMKRHEFLCAAWRETCSEKIPQQQFIHLMMIRLSLPCNLARIMEVTGLTSAGASIFVNKLVKFELLARRDDPSDRRNVIVALTPRGAEMCRAVEEGLDNYICGFFKNSSESELANIEKASRAICRTLDDLE